MVASAQLTGAASASGDRESQGKLSHKHSCSITALLASGRAGQNDSASSGFYSKYKLYNLYLDYSLP